MAKPKNKEELLAQSQLHFTKLMDLISQYSEVELGREFPKGTLNRNVRDVLAHLHHWHLLFFDWYKVGMKGGKPDMPAMGYTWQTTPELNIAIQKMYQETDLTTARKDLNKSYKKSQKIMLKHTDEELFTKRKYGWTGSTSLGAYLIMNTSSHYQWAYRLIKKSIKKAVDYC